MCDAALNKLCCVVGMVKVSKSFEVSSRVMKAMNNMVNMRTISESMRDLEREMMKVSWLCGAGGYCVPAHVSLVNASQAGVIEEMVGDTMEALDGDGIEEAADEEVCHLCLHRHLDSVVTQTHTMLHCFRSRRCSTISRRAKWANCLRRATMSLFLSSRIRCQRSKPKPLSDR